MAKARLNIELSSELTEFLEGLAEKENVTKTELVRRALGVLKMYDQQIDQGRKHFGFVSDPTNLDAEIVGVIDSINRAKREQVGDR